MKTTFYCVHAEFYGYGKSKAFFDAKNVKAVPMPKNKRRDVYGMTAFKIWFVSEKAASDLVAGIHAGEFDLDDVSWLFTEMGAAA